ncbi:unnamed protein product, partial [marine sediment metagenome]
MHYKGVLGSMGEKTTIIFLHIRKTSGSSINKILRAQNCKVAYKRWEQIYTKGYPFINSCWKKGWKKEGVGAARLRRIRNKLKKIHNFLYYKSHNAWPDIISGHIPYGVHEEWGIQNYSYFTFLRHPVERWKSMFLDDIQEEDVYLQFKKCKKKTHLFLEMCLKQSIGDNVMVRQLSNGENIDQIKNKTSKDFGYYGIFSRA